MPTPEDTTPAVPPPPPPGSTAPPPPPAGEAEPLDDGEPRIVSMSSYEAPRSPEEPDDDGPAPSATLGQHVADVGSRPVARPEPGRRWRSRVIDWLIGAAAMLLVLVLAVWLAWLSITRPADGSNHAVPTQTPMTPDASATPPANLEEGEVWIGDVDFTSGSIVAAGTPLNDLTAYGVDVVAGPNGLRAGYLDVTATVPFDAVAAELEPGTVVSPAGNGEARIETVVEVLGRDLDVVAEGTVDVVDGRLVIEPSTMELGSLGFVSELLGGVVRELITIEYDIEGLPEGLTLQSVEVTDDGFFAHLVGKDVQLSGAG